MFRVESMMRLLATVVVCSNAQDNKNDETTYYRVAMKQINEAEYEGNENGVYINSTDKMNKKYFEIKTNYIKKTNDGSNEEQEIELVSATFNFNKIKNMHYHVYVTNKFNELKKLSRKTVVDFEDSVLELKNCTITDVAYKANGIVVGNEHKIKDMDNNYQRIIILLKDKVRAICFKQETVFEIPTDKFMGNSVFRKIETTKNGKKTNNVNSTLSKSEVTSNDEESEEVENDNESKEEPKNNSDNDAEKTTVVTSNSLRLATKIVLGVGIFIFCLSILTCVIVVYKRKRNIGSKNITTVETELTCQKV